MDNNIVIIEATDDKRYDGHMLKVARGMRKDDYDEILGLSSTDPVRSIKQTWGLKGFRWVMIKEVVVSKTFSIFIPIAVFGAAELEGNKEIGIPWMVCTVDITDHARYLASVSREYVGKMKERFKYLVNVVGANNEVSISWLRACGFTIEKEEFPKPGYHKFYMECVTNV